MLSLTSEYVLRAMIYLTQNEDDWPIAGRRIAEQAGIPPKYLSNILGDLVRLGLLDSAPGRTGGFRLRRAPRDTKLYDLLASFEQFELKRCPFGNKKCSDRNPCLAHEQWKKVVEAEHTFLKKTSIHDVAVEARKQKRPRKKN